jgi:hypothetical protein
MSATSTTATTTAAAATKESQSPRSGKQAADWVRAPDEADLRVRFALPHVRGH